MILCPQQPPLVPAPLTVRCGGAPGVQREVLTALTEHEIGRCCERVRRSGAESLAICLCTRMPIRARAALTQAAGAAGDSCVRTRSILKKFREYERCSTTVVNAYCDR